MKRSHTRAFKVCFSLFACSLFVFSPWPFAGIVRITAQDKPNFIFILADDMGYADLGADGSGIDTPYLDQLAREGLKFTRFYAQSSICSPTRAAFLTGRYPHAVGVPELASPNVRGSVPKLHLYLDAVTIPEALKPLGYRSMLAGKWHLGYDQPYWPRQHGFDEFWGSLLGTPKYYDPAETYHNETKITVAGHFTDRITDNAVRFIRENSGRPFFLYLAYNAPHFPLEAPQALINKYRSVFADDRFAVYAAMIEQMDAGVGRVLETLDALDLTQRTFVFFTSDNGPSAEKASYGPPGARISAGTLRGHKKRLYEGGIRVPAIARWPGHIRPGSVTGSVATIMDLFPTYLDILGVAPRPGTVMDGASMRPLLLGANRDVHEVLHWQVRRMYVVMKGKWKLVRDLDVKHPELYNLDDDVSESRNLADRYPKITKELVDLHESKFGD